MAQTKKKLPALIVSMAAALALVLAMGLSLQTVNAAEDEDGIPQVKDLSFYYLDFEGAQYQWIYFIEEGTGITPEIKVYYDDVSQTAPPEAYDLKVEKQIGYDEETGEEVFEESAFPLTHEPKGAVDIYGNSSEGKALYRITAVAKEGSGYTGETPEWSGYINIYSNKFIAPYYSDISFPEKNLVYINEEPYFEYDFVKGTILEDPEVTIGFSDTVAELTRDVDYTLEYINKRTGIAQTDTPIKDGIYQCRLTGNEPYYGVNDQIQIKIGPKNPMTVKVASKKLKAKNLKKKKAVFNPFTVRNGKGKVTYDVIGGTAKALKAVSVDYLTGKVTVKKNTKKGTYKIKVLITADGTHTKYILGEKTVTLTIKVVK